MSHVSFYRKWRPQTFEDVVGQERVTRTLQNAIAQQRIVHAYLFCGHRGSGKTTTARILAKALNCVRGPTPVPCNECAACRAISAGASLDVIEIDAASNRGIDEIRDLREKVRLVPVEGRSKVYIIDEAHMLTTEAANALLKTLEEPPAHAVLVLVTTEPHRLPTTITSRTQRFDFKRIPQDLIVARLGAIARAEGVTVDEEACRLIARSADGALRDAESLLDQVAAFCGGTVTKADVLAVLGVLEEEIAHDLAQAVLDGDAGRCLALAGRVIDEGRDVRQVLRSLVEQFRDLLVVAVVCDAAGIVETTEQRLQALRTQAARVPPGALLQRIRLFAQAEADARSATQPRVVLEMALLRAARPEMDPSLEGLAARVADLERGTPAAPDRRDRTPGPAAEPDSGPRGRPGDGSVARASRTPLTDQVGGNVATVDASVERASRVPRDDHAGGDAATVSRGSRAEARAADAEGSHAAGPAAAEPASTADTAPADPAPVTLDTLRARWGLIMDEVKAQRRTVHAFLLESAPQGVSGSEVTLGVRHPFHMENLHDHQNRRIVEDALGRVLGGPYRIRLALDEALEDMPVHDDAPVPSIPPASPAPPGRPVPSTAAPSSPPAPSSDGDDPAGSTGLVAEAVRRFGNPVQEIRRFE